MSYVDGYGLAIPKTISRPINVWPRWVGRRG
jgi:hypothetical protein